MRLVQVSIPAGKRQAVLSALDDEGVDYVVSDETSGRRYTAVVTFPLPTSAVEPVLDTLRDAGIDEEAYTVVINAETVVSRRFERLAETYEESAENGDRIAREELVSTADDLVPGIQTYVLMTVISAVVATAGLLLDSPAVVVGSMVLAPLVGPAMATSVGTVVSDGDLFQQGVRLQIVGGFLAVAAAAVFAVLLKSTNAVPLSAADVFATPEIRERLVPDVLSLAVALGAGVAGALSLSSGVSTALVGVMIAAALVPPTAVVGIGIAWQNPEAVLGSGVLVLVNFLSINFAALVVLWYQGYRPKQFLRFDQARTETLTRVAVLGVAILVLSAFLGGVTYSSYQTTAFERAANDEAEAVVSAHDGATLLAFEIEYDDPPPYRQPTAVVVTVGYPASGSPPPVADEIATRVSGLEPLPRLGLGPAPPITVEVRYVPVERSRATP